MIRPWYTDLGPDEAAAVQSCMAAGHYSMGPVVAEFETALADALGVPYVVACSSGTSALMMAVRVHNWGPNDDIYIPTRTFVGTANAAAMLGADVVLADEGTRTDIAVHLNGHSGGDGMIIDDACQALFSVEPGVMTCYSFGMAKLITTIQGGAVAVRHADAAEALRDIRDNGRYQALGFNAKMTDIAASIGLVQLAKREQKIAHLRAVHERYRAGLQWPLNPAAKVPLWAEVRTHRRDELHAYLLTRGIQARKHTPCVHTAPQFATARKFPIAERIAATTLQLPGGPGIDMADVDKVIEAVNGFAL